MNLRIYIEPSEWERAIDTFLSYKFNAEYFIIVLLFE